MSWKDALDLVVPPEGKPHSRQWYAWAGFGVFSFWLFFLWSIGLAPDAFGEGFARAEETRFNTQILLEQRLSTVKQRQCMAEDAASKTYWSAEMLRLTALYKQKLGLDYHEPPCRAILVAD